MKRSTRGLTLIELIVLLVIVGVFAALVLPMFAPARINSRRTSCASNLKQIGVALEIYADVPAHGAYPTYGGSPGSGAKDARLALNKLFNNYISDYRLFSCPNAPTLGRLEKLSPWNDKANTPGTYPLTVESSGYGYDQRHTPSHSMAAIASDTPNGGLNNAAGVPNNHGVNAGHNVLIGSGSVEFITTPSRAVGDGLSDPNIFENNVSEKLKLESDGFIE
jgi:type II secretory pathway pseudopilin PulG